MDDLPSNSKNQTPATGNTPIWLRKSLVTLLIISACGGFVSTGWTLHHSIQAGSEEPIQISSPGSAEKPDRLEEWISRMEQSIPNGKSVSRNGVTCQGMIAGDQGGALAVVNGQTVAAGSRINGVNIVEITADHIVVESGGQTRILEPGDSFVPKK